jgi:thioredoxin reductase
VTLDYLIIGAGPAGLQLAALLEAEGKRDYLVLERAAVPGAFFARYPRHRQLISINKVHTGTEDPELNLRLDWNSLLSDDPSLLFTGYTERYFPDADVMVRYLADFAAKTGVKVRYDTPVERIAKDGDEFVVNGSLRARRVIVATGVSRAYEPGFEGFELAERYDEMSVDPRDFLAQSVLIIGKGNSAFETADALMETTTVIHVAGPSPVRMAWRTHYVGHLRAVNNNFLDTYQLKSANAILDGTIKKITRSPAGGFDVTFSFSRVDEVVKELHYDRVLACTGFRFDDSIFDESCRPELVIKDRFPAQTAEWESPNVPGLYFAGTISQVRDFKKSTSGFVHGFRYAVRALHKILEQKYAGELWPAKKVDATPAAITDAIIARVNRTSALWQQFGFLADVVTIADGQALYQDEVPVDYLAAGGLGSFEHAFAVTLEYGPDHAAVDPFDITVSRIAQDVPGQAHDAAYLHPVVRHHRDGQVVATHHLAENLANVWDKPDVHFAPLAAFVQSCL